MYKDFQQSAEPVINRREFVKGGASGAAAVAFSALGTRAAAAPSLPFTADYGPLAPKACRATGLELIALPEGFEYFSFGWRGQRMSDGNPTPADHDGMAVVASKGNQIAVVRNHEISGGEQPPVIAPYAFNPDRNGGTTNLIFDTLHGRFTASWGSLAGTHNNCAGGPTPWGTWLSCEETTASGHGWIFEVPGFGVGDAQPIRDAGRFSHEAVAVDPATGWVYLTEDARPSALYRFRPNGDWGDLKSGGTLEALAVAGEPDFNFGTNGSFPSFANGSTWNVEWVAVQDPHAVNGRAFDSAPGRASFSRGEGCWEDNGKIYFISTDGGGIRKGQVYEYDPRREKLTMAYESRDANDVDNPDNVAVSPRGGIVLCEDGAQNEQRLIGLSQSGGIFEFARNKIVLSGADIAAADSVYPGVAEHVNAGDYRGREWAGATFYNRWLFVNIQSPGITFAITGPWDKGGL